ncbi:MAG: hypothetical protein OXE81_05940 [Gammaproteobacteria bacterium]|nr:hypothetical protein [Gammaproteobacteria bacterium]
MSEDILQAVKGAKKANEQGRFEVLPNFGQVAKACSKLKKETREWDKREDGFQRVSRAGGARGTEGDGHGEGIARRNGLHANRVSAWKRQAAEWLQGRSRVALGSAERTTGDLGTACEGRRVDDGVGVFSARFGEMSQSERMAAVPAKAAQEQAGLKTGVTVTVGNAAELPHPNQRGTA